MNLVNVLAVAVGAASLVGFAGASVVVPEGTEVDLRFDDYLSSNHSKVGEHVRLHVAHNVVVDGVTIIPAGTRVGGYIIAADKNGRYGKNGRLRFMVNPIQTREGKGLPVQPRDKGKEFSGSRTDQAAIATGGGAVLLGPVGLVGGYFIAGKQVHIKPGDNLRTEVSKTTRLS